MQSKHSENRQSWTYQEDKLLLELIKLNGCSSWNQIASELQSQNKNPKKIRSPASCRERYQNILNPNLNKSVWTESEEQQLFNLQQSFGNSWARIASQMTGRSDLLCKNYFYATLRKVLRRLSNAVGIGQSSDLLKQIKPSVLSEIYCNEDSLKCFKIDEEMKTQFKQLIKKYRHAQKSELRKLNEEEISHIKKMLHKLFTINNNYINYKAGNIPNNSIKQDLTSLEIIKYSNMSQNQQSDSKLQSKIQQSQIYSNQQEYLLQKNFQAQIIQEQIQYSNLNQQFHSNFYTIPSHSVSYIIILNIYVQFHPYFTIKFITKHKFLVNLKYLTIFYTSIPLNPFRSSSSQI